MTRSLTSTALAAAGAIVLASLSVTSCSAQSSQSIGGISVNPAQAVSDLYATYSMTVAFLKEAGWDAPPDDATSLSIAPEVCSVTSRSDGFRYADTFLGPAKSDPRQAAHAVAGYWKGLGMTTSVFRSTNRKDDRITARGETGDLSIEYMVNPERSSMSIVTTCIPGDGMALIKDVIEYRKLHDATSPPEPSAS